MPLDPMKTRLFRMNALQRGIDPAKVDSFLRSKEEEMQFKRMREAADAGILSQEEAYKSGIPIEQTASLPTQEEKKARAKTKIEKEQEGKQVKSIMESMIKEFENIPSGQKGVVEGYKRSIPILGQYAAPEAIEYEETKQALAGTLKGALGDTGVLTDSDLQRITGMLPSVTDTDRQKELAYKRINVLLKDKYGLGIDLDKYGVNKERDKKKIETEINIEDEVRQSDGLDAIKALRNIPGSAVENVKDIVNVVTHPIQTATSIKDLAIGSVQKLIPGEQDKEIYADKLAEFYKNRYGGLDNLKKTIEEDPVGFALDVSAVLGIVGGGLKLGSKVASVAGATEAAGSLSRSGGTLANISKAVDPIESITRGVSKVGSKALPKKIAPFSKSVNKEAAALAQERGIELPASAITESKVVRSGEAIAQHGLFGRKVSKIAEKAIDDIRDLKQNLTDKALEVTNTKDIGEVVKGGFTEYKNKFNARKNNLYDKISTKVGDAPAVYDDTINTLQNIIDQKKASRAPGTHIKYYEELLSNIQGKPGLKVRSIKQQFDTYNNLKQTRSVVGNKLKSISDPIATGDKAALKKVYASLSNDLDTTIKQADPALSKLVEGTNAFYRDGINKINSTLGKKIANSDPEKLVDDLVKPNSETAIENVKEIIGDEATSELQKGFLNKLFDKSISKSRTSEGLIDKRLLKTQMKKYGESTVKSLLTEEQYSKLQEVIKELDDIEKIESAVKRGVKPAEGSQTAFLSKVGLGVGLGAMNPGVLVQAILGDFALSKLFGTQTGRKLLTEGTELPKIPAFSNTGNLPSISQVRRGANAARELPNIE